VAAGDITADGRTDFLATIRRSDGTDEELWVLTGYHGATVDQAIRLSGSAWKERDIVLVQDVSGDKVADLVYRSDASGRLLLRSGVAEPGGGVDLTSLASAASASGGADAYWTGGGWTTTSIPQILGTPDSNGDGIPDVWTVRSDGSVRFYAGGHTSMPGSGTEVVSAAPWWQTRIAVG
jgi:hypothetical protein